MRCFAANMVILLGLAGAARACPAVSAGPAIGMSTVVSQPLPIGAVASAAPLVMPMNAMSYASLAGLPVTVAQPVAVATVSALPTQAVCTAIACSAGARATVMGGGRLRLLPQQRSVAKTVVR